jgi:phosphoglucomutase
MLANVPRLVAEYYTRRPDPAVRDERVSFGTSGHRGSSVHGAFNEHHLLAITQAICEYRRGAGIDGPVFVGIDTHAGGE